MSALLLLPGGEGRDEGQRSSKAHGPSFTRNAIALPQALTGLRSNSQNPHPCLLPEGEGEIPRRFPATFGPNFRPRFAGVKRRFATTIIAACACPTCAEGLFDAKLAGVRFTPCEKAGMRASGRRKPTALPSHEMPSVCRKCLRAWASIRRTLIPASPGRRNTPAIPPHSAPILARATPCFQRTCSARIKAAYCAGVSPTGWAVSPRRRSNARWPALPLPAEP